MRNSGLILGGIVIGVCFTTAYFYHDQIKTQREITNIIKKAEALNHEKVSEVQKKDPIKERVTQLEEDVFKLNKLADVIAKKFKIDMDQLGEEK